MPTWSFLISQTHSAVSDHEPFVELRTGCPVPRQPPISVFSSPSASWLADRDWSAVESGFDSPGFDLSSARAARAIVMTRAAEEVNFAKRDMVMLSKFPTHVSDILTEILSFFRNGWKAAS